MLYSVSFSSLARFPFFGHRYLDFFSVIRKCALHVSVHRKEMPSLTEALKYLTPRVPPRCFPAGVIEEDAGRNRAFSTSLGSGSQRESSSPSLFSPSSASYQQPSGSARYRGLSHLILYHAGLMVDLSMHQETIH